ncbi:type IV secretion system protein VirB10 [Kaistia hirudinis]|uniref:Type IV secretion system protein VirB10 n=1 Tax=Kaistia hirudinis TaxID=1293440 RepID=A0A840AXJ3_9HYPH|nr:IncP-type conjugal transfer protein TrbI [Kaistia hirudinis]MBB3933737.1 type IV secretion system protein VirB10 [Kaistia hirudinis]
MVQSLKLGGTPNDDNPGIRRINRLPIAIVIVLVIAFLAVIFYGLTSRGLYTRSNTGLGQTSGAPAATYADQLKRGVGDGIIGEPAPALPFQPQPVVETKEPSASNPFSPHSKPAEPQRTPALEPEEVWRARLDREQQEQFLREYQRQQMARIQAGEAAYDAPLALDRSKLAARAGTTGQPAAPERSAARPGAAADLYGAALAAGLAEQNRDPNGQTQKEAFLNADIKKLGYLPNQVVSQQSPYELKRGSVIPATLITGINSDLPGRISAQVSQNVYDSATGHRLLIPQGAKLFGRYDSKVSFGQSRVLVVWTDIIFPNGSTLQLGGMAGTDAEGYGGFRDQVDNKYLQTFGSAILIALIGTGIDMAIPQNQNSSYGNSMTPEDAARINFAETFGRVAERTINKNLDVQPTLEIRPGYMFNVMVDQDVIFPGAYRG